MILDYIMDPLHVSSLASLDSIHAIEKDEYIRLLLYCDNFKFTPCYSHL